MDICYSSRCKFICPRAGISTTDIKTAVDLNCMGFDVLFYYNGKYVGELVYGGEVDKVSDISLNASCGTTFYCKELKGFVPIIQEEVYNSKPLVRVREVTYSEFILN